MDWWGTQIRRPMQYPITPFPKWSARQDLHLRSLGPKPSVPPRRDYALIAPARSQRRRTGEMQDTNPDNGPAVGSLKTWRSRWDLHPHSSRRQRVAFLFSYGSLNGGRCW